MFVDEQPSGFFLRSCLGIDFTVQSVRGVRLKGDDVILFSTGQESLSCFFVKHSCMLVVMKGNGWVHFYGEGSSEVSFFGLVTGSFNVEFISFYDVTRPVYCGVEPFEPGVPQDKTIPSQVSHIEALFIPFVSLTDPQVTVLLNLSFLVDSSVDILDC